MPGEELSSKNKAHCKLLKSANKGTENRRGAADTLKIVEAHTILGALRTHAATNPSV